MWRRLPLRQVLRCTTRSVSGGDSTGSKPSLSSSPSSEFQTLSSCVGTLPKTRIRSLPVAIILATAAATLASMKEVHAEEKKRDIPIAAAHPLDPLGEEEISKAVQLVRAAMPDAKLQFETVSLEEPEKDELKAYQSGAQIDRLAYVAFFNTKTNDVYEARVSLKNGKVKTLTKVSGRPFTAICMDEIEPASQVIRQDPRVQEALRKRGITNFENVHAEPWSAGYFGEKDELPEVTSKRLTHAIMWYTDDPKLNRYAHPIEGLNVVVDLAEYKVIRVIDRGFARIPGEDFASEYSSDVWRQSFRKDVKPLEVLQKEGPSFVVRGNSVEWQKWQFRIGFNPREGLTLHQIAYKDGDVVRPIIHRASIAEMVVPYGDPNHGHYRKNAFDAGEYGLGRTATSLSLGCDCLGVIHYLDAWLNNSKGEAYKVPNAICIHEEDAGLLWRHWDYLTDITETRRARRLVVSTVATVGNYDYAFYWYFYQDGEIKMEVKATGILNTGSALPGHTGEFGTMVAPGVYAPNHEHLFNIRLHMNVDGDKNSVAQVETVRRPLQGTVGNTICPKSTVYETEKGATIDPQNHRIWKIFNPSKLNRMGTPVAYQLVPHGSIFTTVDPESWVSKRAPWIQQHVMVTPYHPAEKFPSGQFVLQSQGTHTIKNWLEKKRNVNNADIVVWHTIGLHHLPRLEDWPLNLVNTATTGFTLHPNGFFNCNPAMDVPPQPKGESRLASQCCSPTPK